MHQSVPVFFIYFFFFLYQHSVFGQSTELEKSWKKVLEVRGNEMKDTTMSEYWFN